MTAGHAQRFHALFAGMERAHGAYNNINWDKQRQDGKYKGEAVTKREPVTDELWRLHLDGKYGIGIIPIRDDSTCVFGAIDIDAYVDLDINSVAAKIKGFDFPLIPCRSKSGGLHLYLFAREPVAASVMQARLRALAATLGYGAAEIFPKQTRMGGDRDLGSWINMPYFDVAQTNRYAIGPDGAQLTAAEFLAAAEAAKQPGAWFTGPLPDGPPCLQKLMELGFPPGTWNSGVFNLGVYCRKAYPDTWKDQLVQLNAVNFPPDKWPASDLDDVKRSLSKKGYGYQCDKQPLAQYCDRDICQTRKFGIGGKGDGKRSQADALLKLTSDFEYFHSGPSNDAYVRMVVGDHKEVWKVDTKSPKVREILTRRFLDQEGRVPSREALNTAVDTVLAHCGQGRKVDVHVRFARSREAIYLDMCDDQWRAIQVTKDGWKIVKDPPVLFRRGSGARPLPEPVKGGKLEDLRPLLNCGDDSQWILTAAWMLGVFLPEGAFCHLVLEGEQGSAKSTTALVLQSMLDPSEAGLSAPPKDEVDATVSAMHAGILAYDNLSGCRAELADVFCRFSTGQGYRTRTLYQNLDVTVASVKLPVLLNGIDATVMRGDLLERSIILKLPRITPENRRTEQDVWSDFARLHPACLGALLDAVSIGLSNLPTTTLSELPRMSDFCTWVAACEPALPWKRGDFISAYRRKLEESNRNLADNDSVASALLEWMEQSTNEGSGLEITGSELLIALNEHTQGWTKNFHHWPHSPEALIHRLVRLAPVLRSHGIEIQRLPRTNKARSRWRLMRDGPQPSLLPRFFRDREKDAA